MSENPTTALLPPKCHGGIRSSERNDVSIDQRQDCQGIFLDHSDSKPGSESGSKRRRDGLLGELFR